MLSLSNGIKIWVSSKPLDMRKSYDSIVDLVCGDWKKNVLSGELFVFFNRQSDKVKLLYWDRTGYCIWQKRLEKGRFRLPNMQSSCYSLSASDFNCLLEGIDLVDKGRLKAV